MTVMVKWDNEYKLKEFLNSTNNNNNKKNPNSVYFVF